jgi:gluconolactonase
MARDGGLLVCDQGTRAAPARISRVERDTGRTTTVVHAWEGLRLNSPNDVVQRSDGSIWFTDPCYGHLQGFRPEPEAGDFVYRLDPLTRSLDVVADDLDKPNGLAFSPSEDVLYLTDSGANQLPGSYHVDRPHHVVAFDVSAGRHLCGRRLLGVTTPGFPDGIAVDAEGRVYTSSAAGVQVRTPDGYLLGRIDVPGAVNFTFGGPEGNVLFITADTAVWAAVLDTRGA